MRVPSSLPFAREWAGPLAWRASSAAARGRGAVHGQATSCAQRRRLWPVSSGPDQHMLGTIFQRSTRANTAAKKARTCCASTNSWQPRLQSACMYQAHAPLVASLAEAVTHISNSADLRPNPVQCPSTAPRYALSTPDGGPSEFSPRNYVDPLSAPSPRAVRNSQASRQDRARRPLSFVVVRVPVSYTHLTLPTILLV